jgi:DNA repair exonuclease SbcCD nuclease subunit
MNKNKALVASDLHLRPAHADLAVRMLNKISEEVDLQEPEFLIIPGDIFHTKDKVYASMENLFKEFLIRISKKCKIIMLVGNHDWGVPYTVHSLQSFEWIPNVMIVGETYKLDITASDGTVNHVGFIGYCREKERFETLMQDLQGCDILFGHLDLNGFDLGSGWEETDAFCGEERFVTFKKVFSGHFHKAQQKTLTSGTEIIYIGTGYTTDFNESDQEKRLLLINLETGDWEPISTHMTLHKTIKIEARDPLPVLSEEDLKNGVHFRIRVAGTKEEIANFKAPSQYPAKIVYDFKNSDIARLDINAADSHEQMMTKFVDHEIQRVFGSLDESKLDRPKLLKIGKQIMAKAGQKK